MTPPRHAFGSPHRIAGFALLLEVVVALFVLGILATAYFSHMPERILAERIAAEDEALDDLTFAIQQSLLSTDLSGVNIAALDDEIGSADVATAFSTSTAPEYTTTASNDWFAKLARLRGTTVLLGSAPSPEAQPGLNRILYNSLRQPRLLFLRTPLKNECVQMMLVSLLATPRQLVLPAYDPDSTWFDAIWDHDFSKRTLSIPSAWQAKLTAEQAEAWNHGRGGSNLNRLRVVRITIPRYVFNVNNNDPTNTAWVYWNNGGIGSTRGRLEWGPARGATSTPPIISGRIVTCKSGTSEASATINYLSPLQSTGSFTVK